MIIKFLVLLLLPLSVLASDISATYLDLYEKEEILEKSDLEKLKNTEIVLIPGIVSESFIGSDERGLFDFSFIFKDYFGAQLSHYEELTHKVSRLKASSKSVQETIEEIQMKMNELSANKRKALFVTHSLGGLALLDWMMMHHYETLRSVKGIVFLQPPFYGSPMASLYFENPYEAKTLLGPVLPFFNVSEETVHYLSVEDRQKTMKQYEPRLKEVLKDIPVITIAGTSLEEKSLFRPSLNIMGRGCVTYSWGKCRSKIVYSGELSDSDGMVPVESAKLPGYDFVKLPGVDHGETVLSMPFNSIDRVRMTDALIRMVLRKGNGEN